MEDEKARDLLRSVEGALELLETAKYHLRTMSHEQQKKTGMEMVKNVIAMLSAEVDGCEDTDAEQPQPDEIDWSHVAPEFKWMARDDKDQSAFLFTEEPFLDGGVWESRGFWHCLGSDAPAAAFASYKPGTCDWKDSLVKRPG